MTPGDAYDVATVAAALVSVAALVFWVAENWPEWRARHDAFENCARWNEAALLADAYGRRGTVTEPFGDPSPDPRSR